MAEYFSDDEIRGLDSRLVIMLDYARQDAGVPFVLTETVASGGSHVENTAHQRGLAVDIRCHYSRHRMSMVRALLRVGFSRIGVYDRHIHVDIDESLPQGVMWWGKSK